MSRLDFLFKNEQYFMECNFNYHVGVAITNSLSRFGLGCFNYYSTVPHSIYGVTYVG